jgi:endonuclease-3 related protein
MATSRALSLYRKLLFQNGPQGWWPAKTQFEVVVGALLTQNTNWKNVEKAIANLRAAGKLSPEAILETQNPELETLIRPSGYYRQKAERLKALSRSYVSFMARGKAPSREELLAIKGVGKETADSILLYAFGEPYFVIDAYTRRFCEHNKLFKGGDYDDYRAFFERSLPRNVQLYKEYHALIVAWGKGRKAKAGRTSPSRSAPAQPPGEAG